MKIRHFAGILCGTITIAIVAMYLAQYDIGRLGILLSFIAGFKVGYWTGAFRDTLELHKKLFLTSSFRVILLCVTHAIGVALIVFSTAKFGDEILHSGLYTYLISFAEDSFMAAETIWGALFFVSAGIYYVAYTGLIEIFTTKYEKTTERGGTRILRKIDNSQTNYYFFRSPLAICAAGIAAILQVPFFFLIIIAMISIISFLILFAIVSIILPVIISAGNKANFTITIGVFFGGIFSTLFGEYSNIDQFIAIKNMAIGASAGFSAAGIIVLTGRMKKLILFNNWYKQSFKNFVDVI